MRARAWNSRVMLCAAAAALIFTPACRDEPTALPFNARTGGGTVGLQDLGTLGGTSSGAVAINRVGHVVGRATTGSGSVRGFFWAGTMDSLPPVPGSTFSYAYGINDLDQVVGIGDMSPFTPALWVRQGGVWTVHILPMPNGQPVSDGNWAFAYDINNDGHAVGGGSGQAVLWTIGPTDTSAQSLPIPVGYTGNPIARSLNNTGQIVGGPFLWSLETGGTITVATLPGVTSGSRVDAYDVADLSGGILRVTGIEATSRNPGALRWTLQRVGASWQVVRTELLSRNGFAYGINNLGEVAGIDGGKAVVWALDGSKVGLPGSGGEASEINDLGRVVGDYFPQPCCLHAVLWSLR